MIRVQAKLDVYRDTLSSGKPLNEDQQAAVDKYDEVLGTLEFAKDLTGQFNKLALDEAKDKKKLYKKEQQEKAREELSKVQTMLAVRAALGVLASPAAKEELLTGAGGAPQLTPDQVSYCILPLNRTKMIEES